MPEAKGLLLLANDGNYSLEAKNVLYIIVRLLNSPTQFPFINTILYFTPNLPARLPNGDIGPLWMSFWRDMNYRVSPEFLDQLGQSWAKYHGKLLGINLGMESYVNEEGIDQNFLIGGTEYLKGK